MSNAGALPWQQAPREPKSPSSATKPARASTGTHQPGQAHGQILLGLKPEGADVSVDVMLC
ncbi:hypothetical protein Pyn_37072 [Prunus yedoensis var. nudiflora]|uniref:Uncharacterized protein n=1 Tax=Prunus yedoensis var. nudiflora TaxID=2094558 RepID=A0A314ZT12_PRUYE|nr:hypothetical protein Pyn_37072 [Prunus yedoensis var. nudiflora]